MLSSFILCSLCFCFFFQAEDGIRDIGVTGVQTCALPIWYLNALGRTERTPAAADPKASFIGAIIVPQGWYYQEELNYCRCFQVELATSLETNKKRVSPVQVKADTQAFEQMMP